jgi:toxin ParE1/3/4
MEASESTANRFMDAIIADLERLQTAPLSGAPRDQLSPGLRAAFHGRYVAYYLPTMRELVIVRVLHGARDIAALADQGGFSAT